MDCCMAWSKNATNFLGTNCKSLPLIQFKTNTIMWLEHENSGVIDPAPCDKISPGSWLWEDLSVRLLHTQMEEWVFIPNPPHVNKATWMLLSDGTKTLCKDFGSLIPTLFSRMWKRKWAWEWGKYLSAIFLFADMMAPTGPDSATGDGPSFISLLDPRTGKVFCNGSHIYTAFYWHLILWSSSQL